jgi:WD40 repeat protein
MDRDNRQPQRSSGIEIGAGARLGDITVRGDVAGRDIVHITEELSYDVSDLSSNPYLGLASYTYATREFYGGREPHVRDAVTRLTEPGEEPVLMFVTGASGSGKSSFAQAGLLPALEEAYALQRRGMRWSITRPGRHPIAALGRALRELGIPEPPDEDWTSLLKTPDDVNRLLATQTATAQVNVIVLDQFEELFTQSDLAERDTICGLLAGLGTFSQLRTHVIATLRADYLSALFEAPTLLECFKRDGIELRAMSRDELTRAIRQPLQAQSRHDGKDKRLDPALVERLVEDVGEDPSVLPLLQVTLRALWDEPPHRMVLERYRSLTDTLEQQANQVVERDVRGRERTPDEREQLMSVFLDLVEVSLDDDVRRDVRRTLPKHELLEGHPERAQLVEQLIAARLVTTSVEHVNSDLEVIDIIHETLLSNWPRLSQEIAARREGLQQRERFRMALREWLKAEQSPDYLLRGVRLAEARSLAEHGDIALRGPDARALLDRSNAAEAEERMRALHEARRRQRVLAGLASLAVVLAVAALSAATIARGKADEASTNAFGARASATEATFARNQAQASATEAVAAQQLADANAYTANANAQQATSRELASSALSQLNVDPELSLLLAQQAMGVAPTAEAESALRQSLLASRVRATIRPPGGVRDADISTDGRKVVAVAGNGSAGVWDLAGGVDPVWLQGHTDQVTQARFSPDGQDIATASKDATARVWDAAAGTEVARFQQGEAVESVAFDRSGHHLLTHSADGKTVLWDLATQAAVLSFQTPKGQRSQLPVVGSARFVMGDTRIQAFGEDRSVHVWDATTGDELPAVERGNVVSPDGARVVSGGDRDSAVLMESDTGRVVATLTGDANFGGPLTAPPDARAVFSPDSSQVVTAGSNGSVRVWNASTGALITLLPAHSGGISSLGFSSDGRRVATSGADGTVHVSSPGGATFVLRGHTGALTDARLDASGDRVLSVSNDGSARVWDVPLVLGDGQLPVDSVTLNPEADTVLVVAGNRLAARPTAQVWDALSGRLLASAPGAPSDVPASNGCAPSVPFPIVDAASLATAVLSPDGKLVLSSTGANTSAQIWQANTGRIQSTCLPKNVVQSVVLSPDGQYASVRVKGGGVQAWRATTDEGLNLPSDALDVVFSADGTHAVVFRATEADMWDIASGMTVRPLAESEGLSMPRLSPDGSHLAAVSASTLRVWDLESGRPVQTLPLQAKAGEVTFNADGSRLLAIEQTRPESAAVWDASSGQQLESIDAVSAASFSPDGRQLLVLQPGGRLRVGPPGSLRDLTNASLTGSAIRGAIFSPDGAHIAIYETDGEVRFWDAALDREVITLRDHTRNVTTLAFSRDGTRLVTASSDGTARVYGCEVTCAIDDVLKLAQTRVTRDFSDAERQRFLH